MHIFQLTEHFASDYSILMAIVDLLPVALFFVAGLILLKNLYKKFNVVFYSLLAAGTIMVFTAGLLKSIWKIIAAAGVCDFAVLNLMFFPLSSIGFILFGVAMGGYFIKDKEGKTITLSVLPILLLPLLANANELPLEMKNTGLPFIIIQTFGCAAAQIMLFIVCLKNKKTLASIFIAISFISMWGMAGLAAGDGKMNVTLWNWLEEITNTVSQGAFLLGIIFLFKRAK